ncbi:MAG: hypothetical protein Q9M20_00990 [Mariprofundaceae bacterium]|nr:hypothetical protein [Mariprofundaceae bacterium]
MATAQIKITNYKEQTQTNVSVSGRRTLSPNMSLSITLFFRTFKITAQKKRQTPSKTMQSLQQNTREIHQHPIEGRRTLAPTFSLSITLSDN